MSFGALQPRSPTAILTVVLAVNFSLNISGLCTKLVLIYFWGGGGVVCESAVVPANNDDEGDDDDGITTIINNNSVQVNNERTHTGTLEPISMSLSSH